MRRIHLLVEGNLAAHPPHERASKEGRKHKTRRASNALSRLPELEPSEKKVMEVMSERIVRRLLHEPTIRLKEAVRGEDSQKSKMLASAMANLFGLDLQEEQEEGEKENSGRNNDDDRMLRTFTSGKENERGTSSPI